jgi:nitrite reductase/ring-hydroxylating ferredoxin subunit/uncharacterized membrane protein
MKSAANFKSHPLHAAMVPFPFAFLLGGFGFDVAARLSGRSDLWQTGQHLVLAGIVAALLAAVPGFLDYFRSVPPRSSGKSRATKHMLLNLTMVASFAAALFLRGSVTDSLASLVLEAFGAVTLSVAGWMGGTLVTRNQIGIDHRYAGAGKWAEESFEATNGRPLAVATIDELEVDQMKLLHVDGRRIVLARGPEGYVAFSDRCPHRGASLADGALICGVVQCPWHGSQFDVGSGVVKAGPAEEGVETFTVRENRGRVYLDLDGASGAERRAQVPSTSRPSSAPSA